MNREEMNKGVQILLERMRSNPAEFAPDMRGEYPPKWRKIIQLIQYRIQEKNAGGLDFLSDAEVQELWRAMLKVRGDLFTKQIMNTLLQDSEELSFFSEQEQSATPKGKMRKVTALDIKVAKEFGMELGEYLAQKDKMGIA